MKFNTVGAERVGTWKRCGWRGYQRSCESGTDPGHYLKCDEKSPKNATWESCS